MNDLAIRDLDGDGDREFILTGAQGLGLFLGGLVWIGSPDYPVVWQYQRPVGVSDLLGPIAFADLDGDDVAEILLGGTRAIQVNTVDTRQATVHCLALSMLVK